MIKILCVGKIKEKFFKEAINEYLKRISKYSKIEIIEVSDVDLNNKELNLEKERDNLLKYINDIEITLIKTSHDAKGSIGFVIESKEKSLAYITDTGYINNKYFPLLSNREVYIMESNHDVEMLNNGPYSFSLRQRILGDKGHLSNYDCSRYLSSFIGNKTNTIVLAHLSEENNTYSLAYDTLMNRLEENSLSINKVIIAKHDEETEEILV